MHAAAADHLQRCLLEHHSFLHCSVTISMSWSVKDTQWTTLDNVSNHVIHFFSLPSLHLVPHSLLPSIPLVPVRDGAYGRLPLPLSVFSQRWAAAISPASRRTLVGEGLTGQGRAGREEGEGRGVYTLWCTVGGALPGRGHLMHSSLAAKPSS